MAFHCFTIGGAMTLLKEYWISWSKHRRRSCRSKRQKQCFWRCEI